MVVRRGDWTVGGSWEATWSRIADRAMAKRGKLTEHPPFLPVRTCKGCVARFTPDWPNRLYCEPCREVK